MQKKKFTTGRLTVVITVVMAVIFLLQYGFYSYGSAQQRRKGAISQLSYLHDHLSEDISDKYLRAGADSSVFIKNPPVINLPIAGYALLDDAGTVLAASTPFIQGLPISEQLLQYTFSSLYPAEDFLAAMDGHTPALSRFYCNPLAGELYAYSDVVSNTSVTLIIFHYTELLDTQISEAGNLANTFIVSVIIIMVVLSAWLYFVHAYDRMILNRNILELNTERRRYKVARASNQNYIWEYSYETDSILWDKANAIPDIILDFSSNKRKEMLQSNIVHPDDHLAFNRFYTSLFSPEPTVQTELRIRVGENDYEWYRITGTKIFESGEFPTSLIGQTTNIHEHKLEFLALLEQAEQDQLTKLLNYPSFSEKASHRITDMTEPEILAMLILDIDNFDSLNKTFGFAFADAILIDIAGRLKKLCPENALIGRYAADEFVILLNNVPSVAYVTELVQKIMTIFSNIITNTNLQHPLSCGIGISLYPVDATTYDDLFDKAETALYNAKSYGNGCYRVYDSSLPSIPDFERNRKTQKRNQQVSTLLESRVKIDNTILTNAIDILSDSKDLHVSINMMLSVIGVYYNLDRIFIREYSEDKENADITYEWNPDSRQSFAARGLNRSHLRTFLFRGCDQATTNMYHCNNVTESSDRNRIQNDAFLTDAQSLVQFGIRSRSELIGCITFCTIETTHTWNANELDTLALLSKLISSYLLHLHSQKQIDFISQIDPLTNTFNFNAFLGHTDMILSENTDKKYAVIYSDISQFKLFNENYGYRAGDRLLITLADILKKAGGDDSVVARITGDKFVSLYSYEDTEQLTELVKSIVYDSKHIRSESGEFYKLALMIGIYPVDINDSAIIAVDRANIARKNVGDYHLCNYIYYDESMHNTLLEQKQIEDSMEEALQNHEFTVYYQPKFDITSKEVIGAEALIRWNRHSEMVPPVRFIPLFEENGFIVPLDYYVLDSVCASLRRGIDAGKKVLPVSVNFSRVHLLTDVLPVVIKTTLERYNIPPHLIEIEITESALVSIEDYQLDILNKLHALGCILSMDDFGSGMSSLNALRNLPFDVLKIDRDFLYSNTTSEKERIVLSNVVRMAFDLRMKVICEGVETEEQEAFLKQIDCRYAQGFLYSRPLPEEQYTAKYLDAEQESHADA